MIQIKDPTKCSGCTACASICPHGAISMRPDSLGFLYPYVDMDKCVECGLCERVCDFNNGVHLKNKGIINKPTAYAVRHKNIIEVESSRSGAVFIALSDWILNQGGVVYGAGYSGHFRVTHKRAATKYERDEFKGSKYVQSDLNTVFTDIRDDLRNGLLVLFSGTPCQTAGLQSFLLNKKLKERLYIIDIVCHGVVSPIVWDSYLTYIENKVGKKIISVNFRDKNIFGWSGLHKESFLFEGEKKRRYFNYIFYDNRMMRLSCNECPYTSLKRYSDITIGDLWGWEKVAPDLNTDDKGCSLVLCSTEKGKSFFDQVKKDIIWKSISIDECMQPNLDHPTEMHNQRHVFEEDFRTYGFRYIYKKYGDVGISFQIRRVKNFIFRKTVQIWKKLKK